MRVKHGGVNARRAIVGNAYINSFGFTQAKQCYIYICIFNIFMNGMHICEPPKALFRKESRNNWPLGWVTPLFLGFYVPGRLAMASQRSLPKEVCDKMFVKARLCSTWH